MIKGYEYIYGPGEQVAKMVSSYNHNFFNEGIRYETNDGSDPEELIRRTKNERKKPRFTTVRYLIAEGLLTRVYYDEKMKLDEEFSDVDWVCAIANGNEVIGYLLMDDDDYTFFEGTGDEKEAIRLLSQLK